MLDTPRRSEARRRAYAAFSRQLAQTILDCANESVTYVRLSGRRSVISRFEAAVIQLAHGQMEGTASTEFIELVLAAAARLEELDRAEIRERVVEGMELGQDEAAIIKRLGHLTARLPEFFRLSDL
jgi:DNA invertase Pin-like site-specific DNA recombinase